MAKDKHAHHSFSPPFEDLTAYGDKEVEPQHHEPYAKRADPDHQPNPKTLSPHVRNQWMISPAQSMNNALQAQKEEYRRRKSVLEAALPVSRKVERTFQLVVTPKTADDHTKINVLQEGIGGGNNEEEKLPPTPVAAFLIDENTGDEKFPWAFINAETGLEVAFYKHKSTDFASHLEGGDKLRKERLLELELYGKTPLYQAQKYRKKAADSPEIIYHWASINIQHASKAMFGWISYPESIEMSTKHETPQEFKLVKQEEEEGDDDGSRKGGFTVELGSKTKAIGERMDNGRLRLIVHPKVDPTLIIIFLAMTGNLTQ